MRPIPLKPIAAPALSGVICYVDLTGFLHRLAYMPGPHGLKPQEVTSRKTGEPTWGIVGTLNQLNTLAKLGPDRIVAFADSSCDGFRQEILASYKRKSGSAYIGQQLSRLATTLPLMGIPVIGAKEEFPGMEAEDLIAKAVLDATDKVIVVSYDKDLLQLAGPQCAIYDPSRKSLISPDNIDACLKQRYLPTKAILTAPDLAVILAVTGDTNDGVKGIGGIGPVTLGQLYEKLPAGLTNIEKVEALGRIDAAVKMAAGKPVAANWRQALTNLEATDLLTGRQKALILPRIDVPKADPVAFRQVLDDLTMPSFLKSFETWFAPFQALAKPAPTPEIS